MLVGGRRRFQQLNIQTQLCPDLAAFKSHRFSSRHTFPPPYGFNQTIPHVGTVAHSYRVRRETRYTFNDQGVDDVLPSVREPGIGDFRTRIDQPRRQQPTPLDNVPWVREHKLGHPRESNPSLVFRRKNSDEFDELIDTLPFPDRAFEPRFDLGSHFPRIPPRDRPLPQFSVKIPGFRCRIGNKFGECDRVQNDLTKVRISLSASDRGNG